MGRSIAQCFSNLDSNQGSWVRREQKHGGSNACFLGEGGGVHQKYAVCNFCSPPTDCISTAVAETAVLKMDVRYTDGQ